jgi:hypothetical protein
MSDDKISPRYLDHLALSFARDALQLKEPRQIEIALTRIEIRMKAYRDEFRADRPVCQACRIEVEIGTEETSHPVPARFHTCLSLVPPALDTPTEPAPPSGPTQVWGYADSDQAEVWLGSASSREEIIKEGREYYRNEGFWISSGSPVQASKFTPEGDWVLEAMGERAYDELGEVASDWPDVSSEKAAELTKLLEDWADKNIPCGMWSSDSKPEYIPPEGTAA